MKKSMLLLWILSAFSFNLLMAQSADEIVATYYKSIGDTGKFQEMQSTKMTGKAFQMGMEFPFTQLRARPNKSMTTVSVQGAEVIRAFDGEMGWVVNPFMGGTGAIAMSEDENKEEVRNLFEDQLINYREKGSTLSLEEQEEVNGTACHVLKLTTTEKDLYYYYMHPEKGYPVMMKSFVSSGEMAGTPIETYYSSYKDVEGMLMPHSIKTRVNGQTVADVLITKIEVNVPVKDEDFTMPK